MIGAHYAAAAVLFRPKETEKRTSATPTTSTTTKTITSLVVGIRSDHSNSEGDASFAKKTCDRVPSQSESCCTLISQSEYCYRVPSQSGSCYKLSNQSESCHDISNQSHNNNPSNTADKKKPYSIKQPIKSAALSLVKNNEALFASLTMLRSQKDTDSHRLSKSDSTRGCDTWYNLAMKVILLGDCSVGKTCFLRAMSRVKDEDVTGYCKEFRDGEMADIVFRRDGKRTLVRIIDTGGQERYRSLTSSYYRGIHGCLLVFDVTREDTFNNIMNWYQDLGRYSTDQFIAGILVGTTSPARRRAVSSERGTKLADKLGLAYTECAPNDEAMTSDVVQRLTETIKKVGLRRVSCPVVIKPQMKRDKKSYKADVNQACVCG